MRKTLNIQEIIGGFVELIIPIGLFFMKNKGNNTIITFIVGIVCVLSYSTVAFGMSIPYVFFNHYLMENDPIWVSIFVVAEISTFFYYIYAIQENSIFSKVEFIFLTLSFSFSVLWFFVDLASKTPSYTEVYCIQLFSIFWCFISIYGIGRALLRTYDRFINYGEMNDNK